MPQHRSR